MNTAMPIDWMPHSWALMLCLLMMVPAVGFAAGDIRVVVDENGVTRLSNIPDQKFFRIETPLTGATSPRRLGRAKATATLPLEQRPFHDDVLRASRSTGLDSALLHAVISVESGYNSIAVSSKGARGLMQLLPATAQRFGTGDLFDPAVNIGAGARYLRHLMGLFNNDLELSLAAYNAGEGAIVRHGYKIPPYSETQRYVPLVLERYRHYSNHRSKNPPLY